MEKPKKKTGRPTGYSVERGEKICELIAQGKSEAEISKMDGMPSVCTIWNWKCKYPEFLSLSARARARSAALFREKALKIAEEMNNFADEVQSSHRRAVENDENKPQYDDNGNKIKTPKLDIPQGWVEAKKIAIQELNREAGIRDDANYGERRKVAVTGADGGAVKIEQKIELTTAQKLVLDKVLDEEF